MKRYEVDEDTRRSSTWHLSSRDCPEMLGLTLVAWLSRPHDLPNIPHCTETKMATEWLPSLIWGMWNQLDLLNLTFWV